MGRSVLLVDDEPAMRAALQRMLKRSGYQVLEAADGNRALEIWQEHRGEIAVVITDLTMPQMNGLELVARLRAEHPEVCAILMTGAADDDLLLASHRGIVLQKPFSAAQLVDVVERALAG